MRDGEGAPASKTGKLCIQKVKDAVRSGDSTFFPKKHFLKNDQIHFAIDLLS